MSLVTAVDEATAALPQPPAVACDMAVAGYWVGGYAAGRAPRRLLYPVGWGTLGFALPASVGAAVTARPTLVVTGDAGALFGIGDLATIAQHRLPVTVLVVDDDGYGMLRFDQDRAGDPHRGVDLPSPDFCALAGAFGIPARRAELGPDLGSALAEALRARAPRLITVRAALLPPRTTSPRWRDPA
jgi:acetolactate synthase-1/2/3 large subunit